MRKGSAYNARDLCRRSSQQSITFTLKYFKRTTQFLVPKVKVYAKVISLSCIPCQIRIRDRCCRNTGNQNPIINIAQFAGIKFISYSSLWIGIGATIITHFTVRSTNLQVTEEWYPLFHKGLFADTPACRYSRKESPTRVFRETGRTIIAKREIQHITTFIVIIESTYQSLTDLIARKTCTYNLITFLTIYQIFPIQLHNRLSVEIIPLIILLFKQYQAPHIVIAELIGIIQRELHYGTMAGISSPT